jgi:hypothetical protein
MSDTASQRSFLEDNLTVDNVTDALTAVMYDMAHSEKVQEAVREVVESYKESVRNATEEQVTDTYKSMHG